MNVSHFAKIYYNNNNNNNNNYYYTTISSTNTTSSTATITFLLLLLPQQQQQLLLLTAMILNSCALAGRNRPPEVAPFPNKLCADDLDAGILTHMSQNLDFRLSDVIRLTAANIPNTITATYNLFLKKLNRYSAEMRVNGKVAAAEARLVAAQTRRQQVKATWFQDDLQWQDKCTSPTNRF